MIDAKMTLEAQQNGIQKTVYCRAGEVKGRRLLITITNNGQILSLKDKTVFAAATPGDSDDPGFLDEDYLHVNEDTDSVVLTLPTVDVGEYIFELAVVEDDGGDGVILFSPMFRVIAEKNLFIDASEQATIGINTPLYQTDIATTVGVISGSPSDNAYIIIYDQGAVKKLPASQILNPDSITVHKIELTYSDGAWTRSGTDNLWDMVNDGNPIYIEATNNGSVERLVVINKLVDSSQYKIYLTGMALFSDTKAYYTTFEFDTSQNTIIRSVAENYNKPVVVGSTAPNPIDAQLWIDTGDSGTDGDTYSAPANGSISLVISDTGALMDYAFAGDTKIGSALLSNSSIGTGSFENCPYLEDVTAEDATSIGNGAFSGNTSMTSASFPSATSIGKNAFHGATSLTDVSLPSATTIDEGAFSGATSLENISLPSATSIGKNAFAGDTSLNSVDMPDATTIGEGAFSGNSSLEVVVLPSATSFGAGAFTDCDNLKVLVVSPDAVIDSTAMPNINQMTLNGLEIIRGSTGGSVIRDNSSHEHSLPNGQNYDVIILPDTTVLNKLVSLDDNNNQIPVRAKKIYAPLLETVGAYAFNGESYNTAFDWSTDSVGLTAHIQYGSVVGTDELPTDDESGPRIIIAPRINTIGAFAFAGTPIKSAEYPLATSVGEGAFTACFWLEKLSLPAAVESQYEWHAKHTQVSKGGSGSVSGFYGGLAFGCRSLKYLELGAPKQWNVDRDNPYDDLSSAFAIYGPIGVEYVNFPYESPYHKHDDWYFWFGKLRDIVIRATDTVREWGDCVLPKTLPTASRESDVIQTYGGGFNAPSGITLHVPGELLSSYQSSTWNSNANIGRFKAIAAVDFSISTPYSKSYTVLDGVKWLTFISEPGCSLYATGDHVYFDYNSNTYILQAPNGNNTYSDVDIDDDIQAQAYKLTLVS